MFHLKCKCKVVDFKPFGWQYMFPNDEDVGEINPVKSRDSRIYRRKVRQKYDKFSLHNK